MKQINQKKLKILTDTYLNCDYFNCCKSKQKILNNNKNYVNVWKKISEGVIFHMDVVLII